MIDCFFIKIRIICKKVGSFKVSLLAKTMNKTDLSHCGQQHICVISGQHHKGYRPDADTAIEALESLRRVGLSSPIAMTLYLYMLLP